MDGLIVKDALGTSFDVEAGSNVTDLKFSAVNIGNIVIVEGQFVGAVSIANVICTVPQQYRPSVTKYGSGFIRTDGGGGYVGYYQIASNGNITQHMSSSAASGSFTVVYTI